MSYVLPAQDAVPVGTRTAPTAAPTATHRVTPRRITPHSRPYHRRHDRCDGSARDRAVPAAVGAPRQPGPQGPQGEVPGQCARLRLVAGDAVAAARRVLPGLLVHP